MATIILTAARIVWCCSLGLDREALGELPAEATDVARGALKGTRLTTAFFYLSNCRVMVRVGTGRPYSFSPKLGLYLFTSFLPMLLRLKRLLSAIGDYSESVVAEPACIPASLNMGFTTLLLVLVPIDVVC